MRDNCYVFFMAIPVKQFFKSNEAMRDLDYYLGAYAAMLEIE